MHPNLPGSGMRTADDGTGLPSMAPFDALALITSAIVDLNSARVQRAPTDDRIIAEHIDAAHAALIKARRAMMEAA